MADATKDPAPKTEAQSAGTQAASDTPKLNVTMPDGSVAVIELDDSGNPAKVATVNEPATPYLGEWPDPEYGLRPAAVPTPTMEQAHIMTLPGWSGKTAQEVILDRAQAQADAIVAAAEAEVARMDAAEKEADDTAKADAKAAKA